MVKVKDGIIEFQEGSWKNYSINVFEAIVITAIPMIWIKFFQQTELYPKLAFMFLGFAVAFAFCIRRKNE